MALERPIEAAEEATEEVKNHARNLVPWLPNPLECDCGALTEATTTYDPRMCEYTKAWECPNCSKEFYREEKD